MLCDGRVYYLIFKEWLRPSSLFNRTDLYNDNAYVTKIKHNKYNVQAIYSFYHNTVRPVIREACYSHLENTCMAASYSHILFGTALTTILPILFKYCYKYCYSDSRNL
jgi:hypothetical protein